MAFYGCTKVTEGTKVRKGVELSIDMPNGDQHYLVCTLTLSYGVCKCGRCVSPEVAVSDPVSGQYDVGDWWYPATEVGVAKLFEAAGAIDQESLLSYFE